VVLEVFGGFLDVVLRSAFGDVVLHKCSLFCNSLILLTAPSGFLSSSPSKNKTAER
jgi:hypothetical protein